MRIEYTDIDFSDLRGDLLADYLIAVDADLRITEGDRAIYEEPDFPVVELARSLAAWLREGHRTNFQFTSLSSDEPGIVTVSREGEGWCIFSTFTPDVRSSVVQQVDLDECLLDFIQKVRSDLVHRGLDAEWVLGTESPGTAGL